MEPNVQEKLDRYLRFLAEETQASQRTSAKLMESGHTDDANLEKVRGNIPGIWQALVQAAARGAQTPEELRERFAKKTEQIMTTWRLHSSIARRNGDTKACVVEEIKLQKAEELLAAFDREMEA